MIASPPESLAKGINLLGGEPIYLKVDIQQSIAEGPELKAPPLSSHSSSILITSPIRPHPPKAEGEISMTTEVRELLSQAVELPVLTQENKKSMDLHIGLRQCALSDGH